MRKNTIINNIFISTDKSQVWSSYQSLEDDIKQFGLIDKSYYAVRSSYDRLLNDRYNSKGENVRISHDMAGLQKNMVLICLQRQSK